MNTPSDSSTRIGPQCFPHPHRSLSSTCHRRTIHHITTRTTLLTIIMMRRFKVNKFSMSFSLIIMILSMLRLEVWKCKDWLEWNQFKRIYFASRSTRSEIAHRLMFFVCFAYCKNNEKFFSLSTKIGKKHGKLISCQYKTTFMKLWMQQCYECIHSNRQNISSRWNSMRRKILLTFPALRGIYELAFSIHNCWIVFCVRLWIRRRRWLHRTFHDLFNMISHFVNRKATNYRRLSFCSTNTTSRFLSASQGSRECKKCPIVMVSYVAWKLSDWNCGDISGHRVPSARSIQLFWFNKNPFCNPSWKWRKFVEMEVLGWGLTD